MIRAKSRKIRITAWLAVLAMAGGLMFPAEALAGSRQSTEKDETVYVVTGADGATEQTIVSDCLKNPSKAETISDKSDLKNIENMKGNEKFTENGNDSLKWQADGNTIYYQGDAVKATPVTTKITYYLDGSKIDPSDLAGRSGKVKIRINYINNEKADGVYVPFVAMSGMILDNDVFSDVDIDNGKVIDDGDRQIAVGMAMPGLASSLGISAGEADIPDSVQITARVKDFSLDTIMTVVTDDIFSNVSTDISGSFSGLDKQMGELDQASQALTEGTETLLKGIESSYAGSRKLASGSQELYENMNDLSKGLHSARSGSASLVSGLTSLKSGMNTIGTGASSLSSGMDTASGYLDQSIQGDQSVLAGLQGMLAKNPDNTSLKQMVATMQQTIAAQQGVDSSLKAGNSGMKDGILQIEAGIDSASSGTDRLLSGAATLNDGLKDAYAGSLKLSSGAGTLASGCSTLASGQNKLLSGAQELNTGMEQLYDQGIKKIVDLCKDAEGYAGKLDSLQKASKEYDIFTEKSSGMDSTVKFVYRTDSIDEN